MTIDLTNYLTKKTTVNQKAPEKKSYMASIINGFTEGMEVADESAKELKQAYQSGKIGLGRFAAEQFLVGTQKLFLPTSRGIGAAMAPVIDPVVENVLTPTVETAEELNARYAAPVLEQAIEAVAPGSLKEFRGNVDEFLADKENQRFIKSVARTAESIATVEGAYATSKIATRGALRAASTAKTSAIPAATRALTPAAKKGLSISSDIAQKVAPLVSKGLNRVKKYMPRAYELAVTPLKKGTSMAKTGTGYLTAQVSGLSPETLSFLKNSPDLYNAVKAGRITNETLVQKVSNTVSKRIDSLKGLGKEYNTIRNLDVDIQLPSKNITTLLEKRGLKVTEQGVQEIGSLSSNLTTTDLNAVNAAYKFLDGKTALKPAEVLNLRNKLDDLVNWNKDVSKKGEALIKAMRKEVDSVAKDRLPELGKLDAKFSKEIKQLQALKKDYFTASGELKDNALSKMLNLTNEGREKILGRLESLLPGVSEEIRALKALRDVRLASGQKVGTYVRGGIIGGGIATGNPLAAVGIGVLSHPSVVAKVVTSYGRALNWTSKQMSRVKTIVNKIKSGVLLNESEVKLVEEAINSQANIILNASSSLPE